MLSSGFGTNTLGTLTNQLMEVALEILEKEAPQCTVYRTYSSTPNLCAGGRAGKDSCQVRQAD